MLDILLVLLYATGTAALFTIPYIWVRDSMRFYYRSKTQGLRMSPRLYLRFFRNLYWHKSMLVIAPLALSVNALVVILIAIYCALFASHLFEWMTQGYLLLNLLVPVILSGYSWEVIVPVIKRRYVIDKAHRLGRFFRDHTVPEQFA